MKADFIISNGILFTDSNGNSIDFVPVKNENGTYSLIGKQSEGSEEHNALDVTN